MPDLATAVIGALILVAGIAAAVIGIRKVRLGKASVHWPLSEGRVRWVMASRAQPVEGKQRRSYAPSIKYSYRVGERSFESTRICVTGWANRTKDAAEAFVREFAEGTTVRIYLNPADPGFAILMPGVTSNAVVITVAGSLCAMIGLITLVV